MLRTYLKTAWRDIAFNKLYSGLNIAGLAIGMAVALLIGLWVYDQCNYDRFVPGYQQAYQVKYNFSDNGGIETQSDVAIPLAAALKNDIPEIAYTALGYGPAPYGNNTDILQVGDKKISPTGMVAGADFLKIIQLPVLKGNVDKALNDYNDIVITESLAKSLFGDTDPIGKTILISHGWNTRVTAVLKDLPPNSTLQFDYITPWMAFENGWVKMASTNWNNSLFKLYASLKPNVTFAQVEPKIKGLVQKYAPATYQSFGQQVTMQPMKDWHLYTEYKNGVATGGLIDYVWMFGIIGVLVLFIACINFMNLSTARSAKRAKEVGIRKVVGSSTGGLITQFLLESVIMAALSFLVAVGTVHVALPSFNALAGTHIAIPFSNGLFWLGMSGYVLFTGLLAGCRPALYLSSMQPVKVLKGKLTSSGPTGHFRRVLVVLQYTCSIALITATIVVYQQIDHARNRPRGYDPNRLVISEAVGVPFAALKHDVMETGVVSNITECLMPITDVYSHDPLTDWPGKVPGESLSLIDAAIGDTDYFKTVGIPFVAGRNFTGNVGADSTGVILNEAAVRRMRLKEPLNQTISWSFSWVPQHMKVIGVVKDALSNAPFAKAEAAMYIWQPGWSFTVMYRISPEVGTQAALNRLRPIFEKYRPDYPYQYHFADERYAQKFGRERLVGELAGIFAALAIFISCLGLFGLASYMAEQRTKEIGIRKVLGASVSQVIFLITKDFILLVGISCVIASPLAFYFLQRWLDGYYYRIHLGPGVFLLSAAMAIVITIVTISFQALKAALMNPVESLRTE
jgi:putative ABC transport system permease protein